MHKLANGSDNIDLTKISNEDIIQKNLIRLGYDK